ncbi:MAG: DNA-processing protein DprA [Chitinophagales bacterium]|jgi:DNA processing protein|nr:DNA-processing protein DprA [Chitinophagales bacterium]
MNQENIYSIALSLIPGLGPKTLTKLIEKYGNAENICRLSMEDFYKEPLNTRKFKINFLEQIELAKKEIDFCDKYNINIVNYLEPHYPKYLKEIDDFPIVLYYKGNLEVLNGKNLAIVGTRNATTYGKTFLEQNLSDRDLVRGLNIISGFALGIDSIAHQMCLKYQVPTTAVLPLSLKELYPKENTYMAQKIIDQGGLLLTESNSGEQYNKGLFPRRNRIIASLSDALLVVESDLKGGSMISAKIAFDYNKSVFALSGKSTDRYSRGCNELIKQNMASLVNSFEDVYREMNWRKTDKSTIMAQQDLIDKLPIEKKNIFQTIEKNPEISLELLGDKLKIELTELHGHLLDLELDNLVKKLPGNQYQVCL